MNFLRKKKAIAPTVNDSTNSALFPQDDNTNAFLYGHENVYLDLPNILGPLNTNVAYHDPNAVVAPYPLLRANNEYISGAGRHFFDGADPSIERVPRSELQVSFDTKKEIPIPPALVPATGVEVPTRDYNYGWSGNKVQLDGMYSVSVLTAPSPQLSHPINVTQSISDVHRQPIKGVAPRQKRSA
jgi:hypothetical protein